MLTFEKIKFYYDKGFWTKKMVGDAVKMGKVTAEEYKIITNEDYKNN